MTVDRERALVIGVDFGTLSGRAVVARVDEADGFDPVGASARDEEAARA
jgi:hypothetical protein